MMPPSPARSWPRIGAAALALAAPACAPPGPYPSLEPRPIEAALAKTDEPAPAAEAPADPAAEKAFSDRVGQILSRATMGMGDFVMALPRAKAAAEKAGPPESESWIEAQQALSRVEAATASLHAALAELDALALAQEQTRPLSPQGRERLERIMAELQAEANRQSAELARIKQRIGE